MGTRGDLDDRDDDTPVWAILLPLPFFCVFLLMLAGFRVEEATVMVVHMRTFLPMRGRRDG